MLVMGRKPGEKIIIGDKITVMILEVNGNAVKLAIDAPDDIEIKQEQD